MKRAGGVFLLFLSVACLGLQWQRAERRLESSHLVWSVQQRGHAVSVGQAPSRILAGAIPMVQRANELDPASIEAAAAAADLFFLLGRDETARELYREALALEARPELYLNLGILDLRLGDRVSGLRHLEWARRLGRRLVKAAKEAEQKYAPKGRAEEGGGEGGSAAVDAAGEPSGSGGVSDSPRGQDGANRPDQNR